MSLLLMMILGITQASPAGAQTHDLVSPRIFGAAGDCHTDDTVPLMQAMRRAVASGKVLWTGDGCYGFGAGQQPLKPPAKLRWRSDFTNAHRIQWLGNQGVDAVEVTGAIDLDGIVLDMGRPRKINGAELRSTTLSIPFGIHGDMRPGAANYLSDVKIGRLAVMHAQANYAIALVNLETPSAELIKIEDNWGSGVLLSGIHNGHIRWISGSRIGSLGPEAARAGQVVSIYAEADTRKKPASWYLIQGEGTATVPCLNVMPLQQLSVGRVSVFQNTDTSVYIHDYRGGRPSTCSASSPAGSGSGVGSIHIGAIDAVMGGKDLLKVRYAAHDVTVGRITANHNGARIVAVDTGAAHVHIGSISATDIGFDTVAALVGLPLGSRLYPGPDRPVQGTNGRGFTMNTTAVAIDVSNGASDVSIGTAAVHNVRQRYDGAQGYCLQVQQADHVSVSLTCSGAGSSAVYVSAAQDFKISAVSRDVCRQHPSCPAILLADSGNVQSSRGMLSSDADASSLQAVRIDGTPSDLQIVAPASRVKMKSGLMNVQLKASPR